MSPLDDSKPGTVARVRLRNYKSIASCSVNLRPLTNLVGPNGAGKSNFLDGLRFTAESLRHSLDHALGKCAVPPAGGPFPLGGPAG